MNSEAIPLETPEILLKALGDRLTSKECIDTDLANILITHILKANPVHNAVAQAKDAILKLASERANPPKAEVFND